MCGVHVDSQRTRALCMRTGPKAPWEVRGRWRHDCTDCIVLPPEVWSKPVSVNLVRGRGLCISKGQVDFYQSRVYTAYLESTSKRPHTFLVLTELGSAHKDPHSSLMAVCVQYARNCGVGGADQDYLVKVREVVPQDGFGQARQEPMVSSCSSVPLLSQESGAPL